jgi:dihydrofolate synthase/folylpolyglutamate synthase
MKSEIPSKTFADALTYLLSLGHETLTIKLGLASTETLLSALRDPHKSFPAVQIAGTNGKGSTAAALDSICRAAGIRTGLFTSPHLISITERIKINGRDLSEADFARLTVRVKAAAEQLIEQGRLATLPTFFEHVTAIALVAFREANIELGILETGLGGRLDSTTAARAEIVAITPIAMDHEEYLGHTLAEIAAEKAAIIRSGVTTIVAPQSDEAWTVILRQCQAAGVVPKLVAANSDNDVSISLRGRHQVTNAATAIALAEALRERGFAIPQEAIKHGLESVVHPGRLEYWKGEPQMLFDGAHNPAAARSLRAYLDEYTSDSITIIFGAMRDKALAEMAATLFPKADELILTELDNPRAANIERLTAVVPENFEKIRMHRSASAAEALAIARRVTPRNGLICVTGSLHLVGAVHQILKEHSDSV